VYAVGVEVEYYGEVKRTWTRTGSKREGESESERKVYGYPNVTGKPSRWFDYTAPSHTHTREPLWFVPSPY
jgi:hypothetical protein